MHLQALALLHLLLCCSCPLFHYFNCCFVATGSRCVTSTVAMLEQGAAYSNEALLSLFAVLEVLLAKQGKQSRHGKPGGQLAEPSGVQVAFQSQLEGTWSPLGRHLEAIWKRFGSLLEPKRLQVEPRSALRASKLSPRGAQDTPSSAQEAPS